MDTQPARHKSVQCTLEAVPNEQLVSNYIYSVPDNSAPYSVDAAHHYYGHSDAVVSPPAVPPPQKPLTRPNARRWLLLFLSGLAIAVVAGLIGGFIGKKISDHARKDDASSRAPNLDPSSCPGNASTTSTSTNDTASNKTFERTIAVPTTGCTPDNNFLKTFPYSFSQNSTYLNVTYNTFCDAGWNRDELFAMSAASTSDCIEACVMYNRAREGEDRWCIGGGFIPDWWNQSKAMNESGSMPFNCFLKSNESGIAKNDRVQEVVSLCLFGQGSYCADRLIK
jgi:hypothetical protein